MVIKKPIFQREVVIQNLNRVALNPQLLENLGLKIGDKVEICLDTEKEEIIIRRENKK